jgi:uncharacterized small protein (DUF1192 family)
LEWRISLNETASAVTSQSQVDRDLTRMEYSMKLSDLIIDGTQSESEISLLRIHPGLNLIQSDRRAPLASIADFIQHVLYGSLSDLQRNQIASRLRGRLHVSVTGESYRLTRSTDGTNRLDVVSLSNGASLNPVELPFGKPFALESELFVWDFDQPTTRLETLLNVLSHRFPEYFQAQRFNSESEYIEWRRGAEARLLRLEDLRRQLDSLESERTARQIEVENCQRNELLQRERCDQELTRLESSIFVSRQEADRLRQVLTDLDQQIERLRLHIRDQLNQSRRIPVEGPNGITPFLYERLDDLDRQIGAWTRVQEEIQTERIRLRDEMVQWNKLTLEQSQHPYFEANRLLVEMERLVADSDQAAARHVDDSSQEARNAARRVRTNCVDLHKSLAALCNELGGQYKEIRHHAAVHELKLLRGYFNEIAANIAQLRDAFDETLTLLRQHDAIGAKAVAEPSSEFQTIARQEGYLQARRRLFGNEPSVSRVELRVIADDQREENARLNELLNRRDLQVSEIARADARVQSLILEKEKWLEQKRVFGLANVEALRQRIALTTSEIERLKTELSILRNQTEQDATVRPYFENPVVNAAQSHASSLLGVPCSIRLPINSIRNFEVACGTSEYRPISAVNVAEQQLILLSLRIAARVHLRNSGLELPVVIEHLFGALSTSQVQSVFSLLRELGQQGIQFLLLNDQACLDPGWYNSLTIGSFGDYRITTVPTVQTVITSYSNEAESRLQFRDNALHSALSWKDLNQSAYVTPPVGPVVYSERVDTKPAFLVNPLRETIRVVNEVTVKKEMRPAEANRFPARNSVANEIDEKTSLRNIDLVDSMHLNNLASAGVTNVENLLDLDPEDLPTNVQAKGFTPSQVDRWQAQAWMLICVPGLVPSEARLLVACGLIEPEQLDATQHDQLLARINRYLVSPDGQRLSYGPERFDQNRIQNWYQSLRSTRSRWRRDGGYSRRLRRKTEAPVRTQEESNQRHTTAKGRGGYFDRNQPREYKPGQHFTSFPRAYDERAVDDVSQDDEEQPRDQVNADRHSRALRPAAAQNFPRPLNSASDRNAGDANSARQFTDRNPTQKNEPTSPSPAKFYLNLTDAVEAAPSIGPKTAERFVAVGINTIKDFLQTTSEKMAEGINFKRISADVIRAWQDQARLVCQVPNLRGHDAQLLVACGVREPEELAQMNPRKLLNLVGPYSDTKEGMKIVRSGKKPDLEEVTDWIEWAKRFRPLQAA